MAPMMHALSVSFTPAKLALPVSTTLAKLGNIFGLLPAMHASSVSVKCVQIPNNPKPNLSATELMRYQTYEIPN